MFGYDKKNFSYSMFKVLVFLVVGASVALGYNSITGSIDPFAGFFAIGDLFGGSDNVGGVFALILAIFLVAWLSIYMIDGDFNERRGTKVFLTILVLAIVLVAAWIGKDWIKLDDAGPTIGLVIGIIVVLVLGSAWITPRPAKVVTKTIEATTVEESATPSARKASPAPIKPNPAS